MLKIDTTQTQLYVVMQSKPSPEAIKHFPFNHIHRPIYKRERKEAYKDTSERHEYLMNFLREIVNN